MNNIEKYITELENEIVNAKLKKSGLNRMSDNYEYELVFYDGYLTGLWFSYNAIQDKPE
jgi:hypothetical protein